VIGLTDKTCNISNTHSKVKVVQFKYVPKRDSEKVNLHVQKLNINDVEVLFGADTILHHCMMITVLIIF
jgi:hypothetical protein